MEQHLTSIPVIDQKTEPGEVIKSWSLDKLASALQETPPNERFNWALDKMAEIDSGFVLRNFILLLPGYGVEINLNPGETPEDLNNRIKSLFDQESIDYIRSKHGDYQSRLASQRAKYTTANIFQVTEDPKSQRLINRVYSTLYRLLQREVDKKGN